MQTSIMYDVRNPEASEPLPMTGLLAAAPANTPEQVHLAFAGDTGMYVSWSSGKPHTSCALLYKQYGPQQAYVLSACA